MDLKEIDILGADIASHWYYLSKAKAMVQLLGITNFEKVLDVGAGSGFFSRYLLSHSSVKEAWCVDISYDRDSDDSEAECFMHFRRSIDKVDADLVLLLDVLEHVDDDIGLLCEYAGKVPCGARFLISVPAFQGLWSSHDIFLNHKRRYRLSQIEDVVKRAGLTVTHGAYYFGVVFPIAATTRLVEHWIHKKTKQARSQLSRHHPLVNAALIAVSHAELIFFPYNRFVGLTAFCLAEKP